MWSQSDRNGVTLGFVRRLFAVWECLYREARGSGGLMRSTGKTRTSRTELSIEDTALNTTQNMSQKQATDVSPRLVRPFSLQDSLRNNAC